MRNNLKEDDHFKLCGRGLVHHVMKATKVKDGKPIHAEWVEGPDDAHLQHQFQRYLLMGWDVEKVDYNPEGS